MSISGVRRQVKVDKRGENGKRQFSNRTGDPVVSLKSPWLCPIQPKNLRLVVLKRLNQRHLPRSANRRYPLSKTFSRSAGAGQTRRQYTAEEKIRIVLEGLQGEQSVAEICRREGLNTNIYYRWNGPPLRQRVSRSG